MALFVDAVPTPSGTLYAFDDKLAERFFSEYPQASARL
jgi:hypothetical protein